MFGAIEIKDLAVQTNANGNYVVYFQHTLEGHKTPVELRPLPSLVDQMCLVYDGTKNKFVPQDMVTYVENTKSFETKIKEVAGTATFNTNLSGDVIVSPVTIVNDNTYLPLLNNNEGDLAFATNNHTMYTWDGTRWQNTKSRSTDEVSEGTTNLYYTDSRAQTATTGRSIAMSMIFGG